MDCYIYQVHQKNDKVHTVKNVGIFFLGLNTPPFLNRQFRLNTGFPARRIWILVSERRMRHFQVRNKGWYYSLDP